MNKIIIISKKSNVTLNSSNEKSRDYYTFIIALPSDNKVIVYWRNRQKHKYLFIIIEYKLVISVNYGRR